MSSHDCQLIGTLPLKAGTSEADLRAALHGFMDEHQLDFDQEIQSGGLCFDDASVTLMLKFFGYGGYQDDAVNGLVAALSPLVDGHGHFEMFDYDTGNQDAARVPYFVAASDFEEKLAKLEYGIAQMKDYVQPLVGDSRFKHLESSISEMMKQFMAEGGFEAPPASQPLAAESSTSGTGFTRARAQLEALKADGLTFMDCERAFAVPADDPYVAAARGMILGDDDIEIDNETLTSVGNNGAWVLSWIWISNEAAGILDDDEEDGVDTATVACPPAQPEMVFEFAVEFGFNFKYYEVPGPDEKTARDKLWNEILTCDQRDAVSSIECVEQRAAPQAPAR